MIEKKVENGVMKVKASYKVCNYNVYKLIELYKNEIQIYCDYYNNNVGNFIGFSIPIHNFLEYSNVKHDLEKIENIVDFELIFLELIKKHIFNLEYELSMSIKKNSLK